MIFMKLFKDLQKPRFEFFKLEICKKIETFLVGNVYNTILKQKSVKNTKKQEKFEAFRIKT